MSLQVWLPLNGNINNQGLYELPAPVFNQFIYGDGKIGKSAKNRIGWHLENEVLGNEWSVMTWLHVADAFAPSSHNLIFCKNISTSTDCQIYFSITGGAKSLNIGVNGPASTLQYTYTFATNTWYHVGATYDGNTVSLYLNGERVASKVVTTAYPKDRLNMQIGGRSQNVAGTTTFDVCDYDFNDFRLYDHCLSMKEVKEIAKGLILHYKLDNNGLGGTNLVINSQRLSNAFKFYGSTWTRSFELENGREIWTATCTGASTTNDPGGPHTQIFQKSTNPDRIGKTYTWSCWIRASRNINYLRVGSETGGVKNCNITTEWQFFTNTWTVADTSNESFIWYLRDPTTWAVGDWFQVKDMKIEEGDQATPWSPSPADELYSCWGMGSLAEIDCSGYNYHGTVSSELTYSSDSARYEIATNFATDKKIFTPSLPTSGLTNSYTITWWAKTSAIDGKMFWGFSDGNRLNLYGGIYCNTADGSDNPFKLNEVNITPSSLNEWHHFAMVGDGTKVVLYEDGALKGEATTYKPITGTQIYLNGWNSASTHAFNGLMNDFRIYVTPLTENDIKELYQIPFSIDKKSNGFGFSYNELANPKIHKKGIIEHKDIIENFGINRVEEEMWEKSYGYTPKTGDNRCITPIIVDMTQYKTGTKIYVQADIEWSGFEATDADGQMLKINFQGDNYIPEREEFDWDSPNPQPIAMALRQAVNNDLTAMVLSESHGKRTLFGSYTVTSEIYPTLWPKARLGIRTNYSNGTASFTLSNVKVLFEKDYVDNGFKINKEQLVINQIYEV